MQYKDDDSWNPYLYHLISWYGAGEITATWDNALDRLLVLQMSIGSGNHLISGRSSACLPLNEVKKKRLVEESAHTVLLYNFGLLQ